MGQQQLLLIILGVIIVGVAIAVGISMFSSQSVKSNQDAILSDLANLAADGYQFKIRPTSMGGGNGTYAGYTVGTSWGASNPNATYTITAQTATALSLKAESKQVDAATITVTYDGNGKVTAGPTSTGF
jgi:hypothetical protein